MDRSLNGWSRRFAVGGVILEPPPPATGMIRIHDRVAPRPLRAILASLRAGLPPAAQLTITEAPRPLTTAEGEHAAFLECRVRLGATEVQRSIGVVIGDDFFTMIDGKVEDPARFAQLHDVVVELTTSYCLGLGAARWRRYVYQPPQSWQSLPRVKAELWLAPGFAGQTDGRNAGQITAFHARPLHTTAATLQHRLLYEHVAREQVRTSGPEPAPTSRSGLRGEMAAFRDDANGLVFNRAYEDDRFVYLLRLETDAAHASENLALFEAVAASVQPVPRPPVGAIAASHWLDD